MTIKHYIRLQLKSIHRDNKSLFFVTSIFTVIAGYAGYKFGVSIEPFADSGFISDWSVFIIFYFFIFNDYLSKLFFKSNFVFPSLIKCIPKTNDLYLRYYLIKEMTSIWNLYIPVFFFSPIVFAMVPLHGVVIAMMLYAGIILFTLLVSNIVFCLNMNQGKVLYSFLFFLFLSTLIFLFHLSFMTSWKWVIGIFLFLLAGLNVFFATSNAKWMKYWDGSEDKIRFVVLHDKIPFLKRSPFLTYSLLHVRMILRSPVLRYNLVVFLLMTFFYSSMIISKSSLTDNFIRRSFLFLFVLIFYPLSRNGSLFAAEGAFFDRLLISPSFRSFLQSRYRGNVVYTSLLFIVLFCALINNADLYYGLFALFFYGTGVILPLSFLSIFFSNNKLNLASCSKAWTSQSSEGGWKVLLMFVLLFALFAVIQLIDVLFSEQAANHFMLVTGLLGGLFSHKWLQLLHQNYMKHKRYKHAENYRK